MGQVTNLCNMLLQKKMDVHPEGISVTGARYILAQKRPKDEKKFLVKSLAVIAWV